MTDRTRPTGRRPGGQSPPPSRALLAPPRRPRRATPAASPEVRRVRDLYVEHLRAQIRAGTYLTEARIRAALDRMLRSVEQDLPPA